MDRWFYCDSVSYVFGFIIKHLSLTITLTSVPIVNPARSNHKPDNGKWALGFVENDLTTLRDLFLLIIPEV